MKDNILVFDFDGTIADTFHFSLKMSNRLALEFNFRPIQSHEVEDIRDKTVQEVIHHLKVPLLSIPRIVSRVRNELRKEITMIDPIEGLREVLLSLKALRYQMGIITTNSSDNVQKFLTHHKLDLFDFIRTTSNITGKHKCLSQLLDAKSTHPNNVIYIGDETRDIDAAKKAGVKVIAVTWGYNSSKALAKHKPNYIVNKPSELIELCKKLHS